MRKCEKLIPNTKECIPIEFSNLKCGDIFRLFDDEIPVINNDGFTFFKAMSNAYKTDEGYWQVDIIDSICG